uniref:Uncharacterized protein n=1 Tax=Cucumis melo TaxID=3656 RepID=A0A9I9EM45_CUCME
MIPTDDFGVGEASPELVRWAMCIMQVVEITAASFPRVKDDSSFRMKLVCNHLTPVILYLLQWVDCSCSFLSLSYFNLFHIVLYKVDFHGRPDISSYGRKATISEFYCM